MIDARSLREDELKDSLESLLLQVGLTLLDTEIRIGAFRFDGIAMDSEQSLVVVEVKVVASKDTLGQLLIYPHVLRRVLKELHQTDVAVKSLLVTTHLDSNVVSIVEMLKPLADIDLLVCTGEFPSNLRLVPPNEASEQVWDQASVRGLRDVRIKDGRLAVGKHLLD